MSPPTSLILNRLYMATNCCHIGRKIANEERVPIINGLENDNLMMYRVK